LKIEYIVTQIEKLVHNEYDTVNKYSGMTASEIAKTEGKLIFIMNNTFVHDKLLCLPDDHRGAFRPVENMETLRTGLLGHVHNMPIYSDWMHEPHSRTGVNREPRVAVVDLETNAIFRIEAEKFVC